MKNFRLHSCDIMRTICQSFVEIPNVTACFYLQLNQIIHLFTAG